VKKEKEPALALHIRLRKKLRQAMKKEAVTEAHRLDGSPF
jgi:hypothetical protein